MKKVHFPSLLNSLTISKEGLSVNIRQIAKIVFPINGKKKLEINRT